MNLEMCVRKAFEESIEVKRDFISKYEKDIVEVAQKITDRVKTGGGVYFMGNGGSAADSAHLSAELMGRFYKNRQPIKSMSLPSNDSLLTEIPNDFDYEILFERQLEAYLNDKDIVVGISTSGNSENILRGLQVAKRIGAMTIGFAGETGGKMVELCDHIFKVGTKDTPRIQETHITLGHVLCQLIEELVTSE